jgi:flagellar hook-length control protein FliK
MNGHSVVSNGLISTINKTHSGSSAKSEPTIDSHEESFRHQFHQSAKQLRESPEDRRISKERISSPDKHQVNFRSNKAEDSSLKNLPSEVDPKVTLRDETYSSNRLGAADDEPKEKLTNDSYLLIPPTAITPVSDTPLLDKDISLQNMLTPLASKSADLNSEGINLDIPTDTNLQVDLEATALAEIAEIAEIASMGLPNSSELQRVENISEIVSAESGLNTIKNAVDLSLLETDSNKVDPLSPVAISAEHDTTLAIQASNIPLDVMTQSIFKSNAALNNNALNPLQVVELETGIEINEETLGAAVTLELKTSSASNELVVSTSEADEDINALVTKMSQVATSNTSKELDVEKHLASTDLPKNNATVSPSFSELLAAKVDAPIPSARSFIVQTAVPTPLGQPQWSQAVGDRVLWLAAQNITSAEIHLNPKDIGPLQVNVSVNQDQATVSFTSHHAVVREVLDQSLNRLREMFTEQGLNLANVDVSEKSFARQQGDAKHEDGRVNHQDALTDEEETVLTSAVTHHRLVDYYA